MTARDERTRLRGAEERALAAFGASGRGTRGSTAIVHSTADETVVRVTFGATRPPRRAWFAVPARADAPVRELSFEDVVPLGEKPWR